MYIYIYNQVSSSNYRPLGKIRPSAKAPDEVYSPWDIDYAYSHASPEYTFETKGIYDTHCFFKRS